MTSFKDKLTDWMAQRRAKDCDHRNVAQSGNHCPDCGHKVLIEWAFIRCSSCNVKRPPFRQPGVYNYKADAVKPMQKFCKNCGAVEYNVLKKHFIDAYELLFAIPIKYLDPADRVVKTPAKAAPGTDAFVPQPTPTPVNAPASTPATGLNVTEANGLLYSYNTRPQLKTSPFNWQPDRQVTKNTAASTPYLPPRAAMPYVPPNSAPK